MKIFLFCPIPDEQRPITEYINFIEFSKKNNVYTGFFFPLCFFFWLIRFKSLENTLLQSKIIYEEVSWYDSQLWEKPFFFIKTDRLLWSLRIKPFLKKKILDFFFYSSFYIFIIWIKNFLS